MFVSRFRQPLLQLINTNCHKAAICCIEKQDIVNINYNLTTFYQKKSFHLNNLYFVDEKEAYKHYENSATALPHFKPGLTERSAKNEQERKSKDIINVASDHNEDEYLLPHPIYGAVMKLNL